MHGAIYVSDSGNTKIMGSEKVDATYASIKATCPDTCSLKDQGCYAQTSFVGMINQRMNRRARNYSPLKVARAEAQAIDSSYSGGAIPVGRVFVCMLAVTVGLLKVLGLLMQPSLVGKSEAVVMYGLILMHGVMSHAKNGIRCLSWRQWIVWTKSRRPVKMVTLLP